MADYYVILKRAVDGLPENSREKRQAIYDKARKALLTQLQNMDPPLAPGDISKQRMSLEEAVRSVERDLDEAKKAESTEKKAPTVEVSGRSDQPDAQSEVDSSGDSDTQTTQSATPKKDVGGEEGDDKARIAATPDGGGSPSDKVVRRAGQDVLKNAVRDANALGAATNAAVKSAQDAADAVGEQRDNEVARIEPTLGDVVVSEQKTYHRPSPDRSDVTDPSGAKIGGSMDEDEPKSRFGMIAGLLLLTGFLAGSGYLLYQNRAAFQTTGNDGVEAPSTEASANLPESSEGGVSDQPNQEQPKAGQPEGESEMSAKTVRTVTIGPPPETNEEAQSPASQGNNSDGAAAPVPEPVPEPVTEPQTEEAAGYAKIVKTNFVSRGQALRSNPMRPGVLTLLSPYTRHKP